jgi:hypothetical protein
VGVAFGAVVIVLALLCVLQNSSKIAAATKLRGQTKSILASSFCWVRRCEGRGGGLKYRKIVAKFRGRGMAGPLELTDYIRQSKTMMFCRMKLQVYFRSSCTLSGKTLVSGDWPA